MRNKFEDLMVELRKTEKVPNNIFNKVVFTIQKNESKKNNFRNKFYFIVSPVLTSIMIFVLFFGFNSFNNRKQTEEFLLKMYDQSNYDVFFLDIDESFLVY